VAVSSTPLGCVSKWVMVWHRVAVSHHQHLQLKLLPALAYR
jgi:hypothetical protein